MIKRILLFSLFLALVATFNAPVTYANEQDEVDRAVATIQAFRDMPEKSIPPEVLRHAKGVAIMTVYKAGFVVSGPGGSGVVVADPPQSGLVERDSAFRSEHRKPSSFSFSILMRP